MQIKSGLSLKVIVLGILLIFFFVLSDAQEIKPEFLQVQKTQELKHDVAVTLKLVQVYVTDNAENPVTDLKLDEFIVYDNKQLQKITDFERFILFPSGNTQESQSKTKNIESSSSQDEVMNRKFLLFFDLAFNNFIGFINSQKAAFYFIDSQMLPSDEVGVLSFSVLKGLTLHEYFTKDHQAIRKVVEQIGDEGRVGRVDNFEALYWREMTGESALDASQAGQAIQAGIPAHLRSMEGGFRDGNRSRPQDKGIAINLLEKLTDLSKALRYIPGHKHIILFSSGIPYSLIHGDAGAGADFRGNRGLDTFMKDKYEETLKELSNANSTVFSINTEALATNMNLPSQYKGEATLRTLSKYTGGKFLGNVQNYADILDTVQKFTGSYYVLGYYVGESYDGRYHNINVKISRPGCKVFAQRGYFNPKVFSKYSDMEKEIHLVDLALSERPLLQTPIDIPMKAVACQLEGGSGICLLARIPGEQIREKIGKQSEIYFLVFDEKDNIIELKRKAVEQSALEGKESLYYSLMPLPFGTYKVSIVMRDMQTGVSAVGRSAVEIPEPLGHDLQLFPPLLLARGKTDLYVRGYVPKSIKGNFPLLDSFPFDPELYSPILGEIPKDTQKIQALLRCSMRNLTKPMLKFEADLIESSSSKESSLPVSILSAEKEGEEGRLLAEFEMPELIAGEYILRITAIDLSSQTRSQAATPLRVY